MPAVTVLYFAHARDRLRNEREVLSLPDTVSATDVLAAIRNLHPAQAALIDRCRVAVDCQFITGPVAISERSEIALIPPVSGG